MNNIEFKTLIEEKKGFVLERHGYYKQLEESGKLHNNDKDFSIFVAHSDAEFDLGLVSDLDELLLGLANFKSRLRNVKKMYGFRTNIEIYASDDWVERSHVNAIWYYVCDINDEFIEKTAAKMAKDVLSEAIKPTDYSYKAREIDCQLIPLFLNGSITFEAIRKLTYDVNLCDY